MRRITHNHWLGYHSQRCSQFGLENSTKKEKVCCQMKPTYYKLQELKNISHSDVGAITQVLTNENEEVFAVYLQTSYMQKVFKKF